MKKLFQRKPRAEQPKEKKKPNWAKISIYANVAFCALVILVAAGGVVVHQSDTNPNLCGTCHIMQPNVQSYLTSDNLDNVHEQAGVECKDCHDYPLPAEISSGVNYLVGNYAVNADGSLPKRKFSEAMCLKCHISLDRQATKTDFLAINPHASHWPDLKCSSCHVSHGEQKNVCAECHDNGGQRMTGGEIFPRAENKWANSDQQLPDTALPTAEPTPIK